MREENPDSSEPRGGAVRALLVLASFLFAFCYSLALVQGASEQAAVVISLAAFAYALGRRSQTARPESRRRPLAACHDHEADPVITRASSPVSRWCGSKSAHATGAVEMGPRTAFFLLRTGVVDRLIDGFPARAAVHRSRSWKRPSAAPTRPANRSSHTKQ